MMPEAIPFLALEGRYVCSNGDPLNFFSAPDGRNAAHPGLKTIETYLKKLREQHATN
jgi:hypothetical protein